MLRRIGLLTLVAIALLALSAPADAAPTANGNSKNWDKDDNTFPDADIEVTGNYTSVYAYDAGGAYYWDLGDGRIQTSLGINSIDDLEQSTLSQCDYVNNYRADFGNDPFMNSGWIQNHINCYGYDGNIHFSYLIVHESDPRYTGNPEWEIWDTWEYIVLTESHSGNVVAHSSNPQS